MDNENTRGNLEIGSNTSAEIPEVETSEIEIVNEFKRGKYKEVSIEDLEWAYKKSLAYYLSRVFPYNHDIVSVPEDRPRDKFLIEWTMTEALSMNNILPDMPLQAYKENGISYTFGEDRLSKELRESFPPPVVGFRGKRK